MKTMHTALGWASESFQQMGCFTAFLKSPESRMVSAYISLLAVFVAFTHLEYSLMIEHLAHLGRTIQNAADKLREGVLLCVTAPGSASYGSNDHTLAERCA